MTTPTTLPKDATLLDEKAVAYLKALGWYAMPGDNAERLYPPLTSLQKANASVSKIGNLYINGTALRAIITDVLTDARHSQSIDGTNTLTMDIHDDDLKVLRSGIFDKRSTLQLEQFAFETVQVRKSGVNLSITFEDLGAVLLRAQNAPFKVAANTTNHVAFVRRMVQQVPRLNFWYPTEFAPKGKAPTELARGNPADGTKEDSWTAIRRIGAERGWRFFLRGDQAVYAPEQYLIKQNTRWNMTQGGPGIDYMDFDFDIGKPVATLKVRVRAERWQVRVGEVVHVHDMGPANGNWLTTGVDRSLFDIHADITLSKPLPILPEPTDSSAAATPAAGGGAATATFGDGRRRTYNLGAVKPHVRDAAIELGSKYGVNTVGGVGARANTSDHPSGYALDFFTSKAQGDALAQNAIDNAGRLKVKYIIWQQAIWKPSTRRWERMADRGSVTANHYDHVHISFNR